MGLGLEVWTHTANQVLVPVIVCMIVPMFQDTDLQCSCLEAPM